MDDEGSLGVGETLRGATAAASDAVSGAADSVQDRFDDGVAFFQVRKHSPVRNRH
jgi:hypothetical protein